MAFHVTQCPACESTFNISARLLQSESGRARCGACLTVFAVAENLVGQLPLDDEDSGTDSVFVGSSPEDYFDPSTFLTRSALREGDRQASDSAPATPGLDLSEAVTRNFFDSVEETLEQSLDRVEQASVSFLNDPSGDRTSEEPESDGQAESDAQPEADAQPESDAQPEAGGQPESGGEPRPEDMELSFSFWTHHEPGNIHGAKNTDPGPPTVPAPVPDANALLETHSETVPVEQGAVAGSEQVVEPTESIRARALETELEDEEALETIPAENLAVLDKFDTPVELATARQRHLGRRLGTAAVIMLLGGLLAAQYLWQHMTSYSQRAQLRPFYEYACNWLPCDLPAYSDINAIRSDNLTVRSHPDHDNSLIVSVVFRNTADFPQPFPVLILSFNSSGNEIVALREFAPAEYLDPALQSFELMPVRSPLQINLEIIDPGAGAVNYTLAFRRP